MYDAKGCTLPFPNFYVFFCILPSIVQWDWGEGRD